MKNVQISMAETSDKYAEFLEKFKPKKTTDDCYTPENVYQAIKGWVLRTYKIRDDQIVRPFWPGGDYERFNYPDGCVVLDNPPFSILSEIVGFYNENGISFFLFAPYLTNFGTGKACCHVITGGSIEYENGARVDTSFLTSLDDRLVVGSPELGRLIKEQDDANVAKKRRELPKYAYPDHVLTASMVGYMAKHDTPYELKKSDAVHIRLLDAQRGHGKALFGSGFLLSDQAAAEKAAAEKAAAEKAAAIRWPLSEREKEIVRMLGGKT